MIEPQPLINAVPINEVSALAEAGTARSFSEFDFANISQTILKLTESSLFEPTLNNSRKLGDRDFLILPHLNLIPEVSPVVFDAWEKLVKIIIELFSPTSGWPNELPQTPENIIPYVNEEACEFIDAIQVEINQRNLLLKTQENFRNKNDRYILIQDLIPRLLWYIARSSDEILRLLTGVEAKVLLSSGIGHQGMLRLTAILTLDIPTPWSIDLATNQSPRSCLNLDDIIQCDNIYLCRYSMTKQNLIEHTKKIIKDGSPEIMFFIERAKAELLEPDQDWHFGNLELSFDFDFITDFNCSADHQDLQEKNVTFIDDFEVLNSTSDLAPKFNNFFSENLSIFEYHLKLIRAEDIERYYLAIMQQSLAKLIFQFPIVQTPSIQNIEFAGIELSILGLDTEELLNENLEFLDSDNEANDLVNQHDSLNVENLIFTVVNAACEVGIRWQHSANLSMPNLRSPEILIPDLTFNLLWNIIRSSYEVMQLVGGVAAKVLQPGGIWQNGTLCLVLILEIDLTNSRLAIDVATGQSRNSTKFLASKAIAISQESNLCQEAVELGSLLTQIVHNLRESLPEIDFWMDGMGVELRSSKANSENSPQNRQSGTIKLNIGFELFGEKSNHT
ncbi:hypothetical protein BCD67_05965 [Oscillatoriales cyanobacterium USR001]|nr:hypothetical protein BCD67_05965 [Oscillatoriales cyanobacterium USR001]